jgi:hypothetical protein
VLLEIRDFTRAIGTCALIYDYVGYDDRDTAVILRLTAEIKKRVECLEDIRGRAWGGLHHYKYCRQPQDEEAVS